jgi:hypothetical protein
VVGVHVADPVVDDLAEATNELVVGRAVSNVNVNPHVTRGCLVVDRDGDQSMELEVLLGYHVLDDSDGNTMSTEGRNGAKSRRGDQPEIVAFIG